MKKVKVAVMLLLVCFLALGVYADELNPITYKFTNPEVTVTFSEPLNITEERYQEIAYELAGVASLQYAAPTNSPENIICTLFGHNLSTTSVTVTHHKVKQYSPRCLIELYHVSACSRCDYTNMELITSCHIVCCPED